MTIIKFYIEHIVNQKKFVDDIAFADITNDTLANHCNIIGGNFGNRNIYEITKSIQFGCEYFHRIVLILLDILV